MQQPAHLPTVHIREEVLRVIACLTGAFALMARFITFGAQNLIWQPAMPSLPRYDGSELTQLF